ncbi:MAG: transporter [Ignavibacteriae bacterium]|nr:transporter [Ignavibacteriota bacterium]
MSTLFDLLASTPLLLLFVVVGLGYLVGSLRIAGFSLGPAAVLFTGILLGALDARLRLPDIIYIFGLILFVYTIGLQSGATFFGSFGRRQLRANLFALGMLIVAGGLTTIAWATVGADGGILVGVFCGALTNTPALASSIETIKSLITNSPLHLQDSANAPVIGYSVAYPFGVIGVLVAFFIFSKLKIAKSAVASEAEKQGPLLARTFRLTNNAIVGKSAGDILSEMEKPGFVLSRLKRGRLTSLVYPEATFELNDLVVAVGTEVDLREAEKLFGEVTDEEIHHEREELEFRRIVVSEKRVVGRKIRELQLQDLLDATITRIRRGDADFVPTGDTVLEYGDRVRVVTWVGNIERLTKYFGDSVKTSSEADFFPVSLGIVLGVLLGMAPIPLPGGSTFTLGFAGGPLLVGLILGRLQRTGPLVWGMPFSANLTLRQIGLVLFLAGVGTRAGDGFVKTLQAGGWSFALIGASITIVVTFMTLVLGTKFLKLPFPAVMGLMSGIQTQPACLAYANEHSTSDAPNIWYATVYPTAMIGKILLAQVLVRLFF